MPWLALVPGRFELSLWTEEEVLENERQVQMAALQHLGPEALKQAGGMVQSQMAPPEAG